MNHIFLFLSILLANIVIGQTETSIRTHYQDVNKQITASIEQGMEGPLYCNEWVANKHMRSWPAVGIYQETTQFWYEDDPHHLSASERNPKTVLLKVVVKRRSAALTTNEEYLFQDGKLLFYYKQEGEEGNLWETRLYFNSKSLFKSNVKIDGKEIDSKELSKPEFSDSKPNPLAVQQAAKKYQELFVKSM